MAQSKYWKHSADMQESLKYPEAHNVFESLKAYILSQPGSFCIFCRRTSSGLILDCSRVEFLDYTGVQTLLAAKDFLFHLTGQPVPIHFFNLKPDHLNRLTRVTLYTPGSESAPNTPTQTIPSLTRNPSISPSESASSVGSPAFESLSSPVIESGQFVPWRSRSSSLSFPYQGRRPSDTSSLTQATTSPLRSATSQTFISPSTVETLGIRRTRSNITSTPVMSSNPTVSGNTRKNSTPDFSSIPEEPTMVAVDMQRSTSVGTFMKKLRQKTSNVALKLNIASSSSQQDTESDDSDSGINPLGGSNKIVYEPPAAVVPVKSILKKSPSNSSLKFMAGGNALGLIVDDEALSHFPVGNAKALKYFHSSREDAVSAVSEVGRRRV
ncbi:hypothetical protein BDR26DRAFT_866687 [Obelidium mucronatum]|nr:hypothetical protein BDR26DRAFT_866687 [Obelidium mucronatum]